MASPAVIITVVEGADAFSGGHGSAGSCGCGWGWDGAAGFMGARNEEGELEGRPERLGARLLLGGSLRLGVLPGPIHVADLPVGRIGAIVLGDDVRGAAVVLGEQTTLLGLGLPVAVEALSVAQVRPVRAPARSGRIR